MMNNIDEMKSDLEKMKSIRELCVSIVEKYGMNASAIPDYWIQEMEKMIEDIDPFKDVEAIVNLFENVDTTIADNYIVDLVCDGKSLSLNNRNLYEIYEYIKHLQEENTRLKDSKNNFLLRTEENAHSEVNREALKSSLSEIERTVDAGRYDIALKLGRVIVENHYDGITELTSGRLAYLTRKLGLAKALIGVDEPDYTTIRISVELLLEEFKGVEMLTEGGRPFFVDTKRWLVGGAIYHVVFPTKENESVNSVPIPTLQPNITDCAAKAAMLYNCGKMSDFDISRLPVDLPEDFSFTDALAFLDGLVEFRDYTRTLREDWQHFRWKARIWKDLQDKKKG